MNVGIIGSGHIAGIHVPFILQQPDVKIVGIADQDPFQAKALGARFNVGAAVYQDAEAMIHHEKPDVVHVLVPPEYHCQLSTMAMEQGCHVLVEKPLALTLPDAQKMIEVAEGRNVHFCVNHSFIFVDIVRRAVKLVSDGAIGDLVSVAASYMYDPRRRPGVLEEGAQYTHWSYKLNGGLLQDLMPHPASLVMEFIPQIKEVQCIGHNRGTMPGGWQDAIMVLVRSDSVLGYISVSLNGKPDVASFALKGTKGAIHGDLFSNSLIIRCESSLPRAAARGLSGFQLAHQYLIGSVGNVYRFATGQVDKSDGTGPLISRFYDFVRHGGEPPLSMEKALQVVDLMNQVWPSPVVETPQKTNPRVHLSKTRLSSPTVLVTGASGFIGTHLVKRLLSENIRVRALVRPNSSHSGRLKEVDVDVVKGNLADAEALCEAARGIKTIYHLGAATSNDWEEHYQSTIKGTEYLIKAALVNQVERLVHVSTLAVYDLAGARKNARITEDWPYLKHPKQMGAYAYSKLEAERLVLNACYKDGLKATVVRPGIVIGPLGHVFFPHLGYRYRDKLFLLLGRGDTILPITYVENTVDGIYQASIENKAVGQIYNLVEDGQITAGDYLKQFSKVTETAPRIIAVPYLVPYLATTAYEAAASLSLVKKGLTSRRQLSWKHKAAYFDSSKAKKELGWLPRVPIEEGLTRTFEWYAAE
jgi:predicted dehydrogenase/nucleoside-diphosphate-sugar epimerase